MKTQIVAMIFALVCAGAWTMASADEAPSYLFVQQADSGAYDGATLTLSGAPKTLWFTDRPVRRAGNLSADDYAKLWQADGTFAEDPPNAAIAIDADETPIVTLSNYRANDDGSVSYDVTIVKGMLPAKMGDVSLFLDWISGCSFCCSTCP